MDLCESLVLPSAMDLSVIMAFPGQGFWESFDHHGSILLTKIVAFPGYCNGFAIVAFPGQGVNRIIVSLR